MADLSKEFCKKVAAARRAQGLTQSALAKTAGCAQSAVSMFESGHPEKLSLESVEQIAKLLNIPIEARSSGELLAARSFPVAEKGYCPNTACLSNIPYVVNGELFIWPEVTEISEEIKYCVTCGEVLERCCPGCGSPVSEGACCRSCGHPRVMTTLPTESAQHEWVAQRREEIRQWQNLRGGL